MLKLTEVNSLQLIIIDAQPPTAFDWVMLLLNAAKLSTQGLEIADS
jgi:hypothetical protein